LGCTYGPKATGAQQQAQKAESGAQKTARVSENCDPVLPSSNKTISEGLEATEASSKTASSALITKMFNTLPRELRDFVYACMFGDATSIRIVPPRVGRLINSKERHSSIATAQRILDNAQPQLSRKVNLARTHPTNSDEIGPCHLFFPPHFHTDQNLPNWLEHVGDRALEEIASVLYTRMTFIIEYLYDVRAFLNRGMLGSRLSHAALSSCAIPTSGSPSMYIPWSIRAVRHSTRMRLRNLQKRRTSSDRYTKSAASLISNMSANCA
jgi:hypothetical protein